MTKRKRPEYTGAKAAARARTCKEATCESERVAGSARCLAHSPNYYKGRRPKVAQA